MTGQWKVIAAAVPFAILAACSSHNKANDSAMAAGAVAADTSAMSRDTNAAMPPGYTGAAPAADTAAANAAGMDTSTMADTSSKAKKSSKHHTSKKSSKKY